MNWDVVELEERFQQLRRSSSALSTVMRATATSLVNQEYCSSVELEESISSYQVQWKTLHSHLELTGNDSPSPNDSSWDILAERLVVLNRAGEALKILRKAEQLQITSGSESLLIPVREAFEEATSRLSRSPWNEAGLIEDVREGRHPLCRLVSLVESQRELTDDQWASAMNAIQQMFGVALSTALARGKLNLPMASRNAGPQGIGI